MNEIPLVILFGVLLLLLLLSAFFSGSETALMTLNRYRLRHLAEQGHRGAKYAYQLLKRPDRLIGIILLGNTFANSLASSLATVIAIRLWGEGSIAIVALLITLIMLIFSEVTPKTLAALHPEALAFPSAYVYIPLLKLLYPLVWLVNTTANTLLYLWGVTSESKGANCLSKEELRSVVKESDILIPARSQAMLLGILDLEHVVVEDIIIPRNEVDGINLQDPVEDIIELIRATPYSVMPVYDGDIDNIIGMFHARNALHGLFETTFSKDWLLHTCRPPYFIPKGTPLYKQLFNFQRTKNKAGLVVDEYGYFLGLVTLSDLLEEVVGEFTTDPADAEALIHPQTDGSVLIDCSITVRVLNRSLNWHLPATGPKTLNGLILEYMEMIPEPNTSLLLHGYPLEVIHTADNVVKTVRCTNLGKDCANRT